MQKQNQVVALKSQDEFIIYQTPNGDTKINVYFSNETVWLSQAQLVKLYQTSKANISEHISHIFEEKELDKNSVVRNFRTTSTDGKNYNIVYYNLDMIISLGYRIKSMIATQFRRWATIHLKEYIIKGFTLDDNRLKELGGGQYWHELLDRIRNIRSSEKALYRQVLDLYATSVDYNPKASESIKFFQIIQNKLHYAAHGHTAAEIIAKRANAGQPFMGLLSFSDNGVCKKDIAIAKNYLTNNELQKLNTIVSAFFDMAEFKALNHKQMYMKDWFNELDRLINTFDQKILSNSGTVSHSEAIKKAQNEYKTYQEHTLSEVEKSYLNNLKSVEKKLLHK